MTEKKTSKRAQTASKVINAYRRLFSSEDGLIVLDDMMKSNFINRTTVGNDVHQTYFNEGCRHVVLRLIQTCGLEETQIKRMIDEMNKVDEDMFT